MSHPHLSETLLLDFSVPDIQRLIAERGWAELPLKERIGAVYDFVRNDILFGYNEDDALPASRVLADGYGQCNTKGTLLMALLRGVGVPCRFHGFTIDKGLQRGVVPELVYPLLEGFILDDGVLTALRERFPDRDSLCAYGAGTDCLQDPGVEWTGEDTYVQKTGITHDFGIYDAPDDFYAEHRQLSGFRGFLYRRIVRHWMNYRVAAIRRGIVPTIPGGDANLVPAVQQTGAALQEAL